MRRLILIIWLCGALWAIGGHFPGEPFLDALDDVNITAPDTASILIWDGEYWKDTLITFGGDSALWSDTAEFAWSCDTCDSARISAFADSARIAATAGRSDSATYADTAFYARSAPAPDPVANIDIVDEFISGTTESGETGDMGWSNGGGTVSNLASEAEHPGILRMPTTSSLASLTYIYQGNTANVNLIIDTDLWEFTYIVRILDTVLCNVFVGATDNPSQAVAAKDGYGFVYSDSISNMWIAYAADGSNATYIPTSVLADENTWFRFRMQRTASAVYYWINDTLRDSVTTTLPNTPLNYGAQIQTKTTVTKNLDIDFFRMQLNGVTR